MFKVIAIIAVVFFSIISTASQDLTSAGDKFPFLSSAPTVLTKVIAVNPETGRSVEMPNTQIIIENSQAFIEMGDNEYKYIRTMNQDGICIDHVVIRHNDRTPFFFSKAYTYCFDTDYSTPLRGVRLAQVVK